MKTIVSYSYSGGPNRSLVTANLAVVLARLGYSVVVADLDLASPCLHEKFGELDRSILERKGMLDYLGGYFKSYEKEGRFDFGSIRDCIAKLPSPATTNLSMRCGDIRLISPGNNFSEMYQRALAEGPWQQLLQSNSIGEKPSDKYGCASKFFSEFRAAIAGLEHRPDYLLIDLPIGLTELTLVSIQALADTVICLFDHNEESTDCINNVLRSVRSLPSEVVTVPVVTQVPSTLDEQISGSGGFLDQVVIDDTACMHVIHADSGAKKGMAFSLDEVPQNTLLVQDLTRLFGYILASEHGLVNERNIGYHIERILDTFNLPDSVRIVVRPFMLYCRHGELINPYDGTRNVAFKVSTFANLICDFVERLRESERDDALFGAGYGAGVDFGLSLSQMWLESDIEIEQQDVSDRINRWCHFDSNVGFGHFCNVVDDEASDSSVGLIRLTNSFLRVNRNQKISLCPLMQGYIQGVLHSILPDLRDSIRVTHDHGPKYCEFHLIQASSALLATNFRVSIAR